MFRPHKVLNEGWRYFKIQGSELVIATRVNVVKAYQVLENGGQPVIDAKLKQALYEWDLTTEIKILTLEEYDAVQNSGWYE